MKPGERCRARRRPFGDRRPVVVGVVAHEVEAHPNARDRAPDHPQCPKILTGVALLQSRRRDAGPARRRQRARSRSSPMGAVHERRPRVGMRGGASAPSGGVVGQLGVVAGDALEGGRDRIQRGDLLHVGVRQLEPTVGSSPWWTHERRAATPDHGQRRVGPRWRPAAAVPDRGAAPPDRCAMTKLSGAHVLITGGSSGIGAATALQVLGRGARVSLVARDAERLAVAEDALEAAIGDAAGWRPSRPT